MKLTQERLKEVLDYNPETGVFVLRVDRGRTRAGMEAGCVRTDGYITIMIDTKACLAHRLAWLFVYGYLPENNIDHINQNSGNNWIDNLREVSRQCNLRNTGNRTNNTSGVKGVSWHIHVKKYQVGITVNRQQIHLGYFKSLLEAAEARRQAEITYWGKAICQI